MICSGCGKVIPFDGEICPYCHRNKRDDQEVAAGEAVSFIAATICGLVVGGIVWLLSKSNAGFWIGAVIGGIPWLIWGENDKKNLQMRQANARRDKPQKPQQRSAPPRVVQRATPVLYRIAQNGEDLGEMSIHAIRQKLRNHELSLEDYFWDDAISDWRRIAQFPGLFYP